MNTVDSTKLPNVTLRYISKENGNRATIQKIVMKSSWKAEMKKKQNAF